MSMKFAIFYCKTDIMKRFLLSGFFSDLIQIMGVWRFILDVLLIIVFAYLFFHLFVKAREKCLKDPAPFDDGY